VKSCGGHARLFCSVLDPDTPNLIIAKPPLSSKLVLENPPCVAELQPTMPHRANRVPATMTLERDAGQSAA
jgi:hypothetical protein